MIAAIDSCWALLLGVALLMIGNGLQGSLLGIRATLEGFPTTATGILMSGYFAGFLVGSVLTPTLVARVSHVRVLIHARWIDPIRARPGQRRARDAALRPQRLFSVGSRASMRRSACSRSIV